MMKKQNAEVSERNQSVGNYHLKHTVNLTFIERDLNWIFFRLGHQMVKTK